MTSAERAAFDGACGEILTFCGVGTWLEWFALESGGWMLLVMDQDDGAGVAVVKQIGWTCLEAVFALRGKVRIRKWRSVP